jgi:hypothetical protein
VPSVTSASGTSAPTTKAYRGEAADCGEVQIIPTRETNSEHRLGCRSIGECVKRGGHEWDGENEKMGADGATAVGLEVQYEAQYEAHFTVVQGTVITNRSGTPSPEVDPVEFGEKFLAGFQYFRIVSVGANSEAHSLMVFPRNEPEDFDGYWWENNPEAIELDGLPMDRSWNSEDVVLHFIGAIP